MRKNKGFSLVEVLITSAILALVASSVIAASIMLRDVCHASITAHELQRNADLIMGYIIRHGPGETAYNGLQSAALFDLDDYPTGSGINFTGPDGVERKFYVQGSSIIYESPTNASITGTRIVYAAPPGVGVFLLFAPSSPASMGGKTVSVTIDLSQTIRGKRVSGNLVTWVTLMNAP